MTRAFKFVDRADAVRIAEVGQMRTSGCAAAMIDLGVDRNGDGTLCNFYALNSLLIKEAAFAGPIALFSVEPYTFADPRVDVPAEEGVRFFPIPFELMEMLEFVRRHGPFNRSYVKTLLGKTRFDTDEGAVDFLRKVASRDQHSLLHFQAIQGAVQSFCAGSANAFSTESRTNHPIDPYTIQALGARRIVEGFKGYAQRHDWMRDVKDKAQRLDQCVEFLERISNTVVELTGLTVVPAEKRQAVLEALEASGGVDKVSEMTADWNGTWRLAAQEILHRVEKRTQ